MDKFVFRRKRSETESADTVSQSVIDSRSETEKSQSQDSCQKENNDQKPLKKRKTGINSAWFTQFPWLHAVTDDKGADQGELIHLSFGFVVKSWSHED